MVLRFILPLVFFCATLTYSHAQQNEITFHIPELSGKNAVIGYFLAKSEATVVLDTLQFDSLGYGISKREEDFPQGMYFIYINGLMQPFVVGKSQEFTISTNAGNFHKDAKITGSPANQLFFDYQNYFAQKGAEIQALNAEMQANRNQQQKLNEVNRKLQQVYSQVFIYEKNMLKNHPNSIVTAYHKASKNIDAPKHITDTIARKQFLKAHYFDFVNLSDPRVLRTPVYERKIVSYLNDVVEQNPDSLIKAVDYLISKAEKDPFTNRYMMIYIYNHFAKGDDKLIEPVFLYFVEHHFLPKAHWADPDVIKALKMRVRLSKPNSVGTTASDIKLQALPSDEQKMKDLRQMFSKTAKAGLVVKKEWESKSKDEMYRGFGRVFDEFAANLSDSISLHSIDANYIIVWFWNPDCTHCREYTPKILEIYSLFSEFDVEVYAIFMQMFVNKWDVFTANVNLWFQYIDEHNLYDWHHVWDVYNRSLFREIFKIPSLPASMILDENKTIIARNEHPDKIRKLLIKKISEDIVQIEDRKYRQQQLEKLTNTLNTTNDIAYLKEVAKQNFDENIQQKINELTNLRLKKLNEK